MNSSTPEPQPEGKTGAAPAGAVRQPSSHSEAAQVRADLGLPSVPDHQLLRCIGHGAYGAVWLARNVMGTYRAVKIVHREDFARERPFTREYEGLLKFEPVSRSHPNLMQVLHVGRRDNYFYYVTELADDAAQVQSGECRVKNAETPSPAGSASTFGARSSDVSAYVPRTLQEDLERRGRLPVRECVSLATALASALKHLHAHELVHRDVKPSNVIFVHGVPKLADVGLVATAGDSRSIVGTEGYLPPEGPGSPQADLYALGKLLYEASSGLNRAQYPRLPDNLEDLPDVTELLEFNEVLLRACAKDIQRRYRQADEVLADLALLERGDSVRRLRRLERHHAVLKRVGVGLLAAALLLSGAWWQTRRAHRIASRHLAQLHVNEGTRRMVEGDYAAALPWLVGALELEAGDPSRERMHRIRIASVLRRCPVPVAHFAASDSRVAGADLNPDDTVLATAHDDGWVRLWDTRSRKLIRPLPHNLPAELCQFLPPGDRLLSATFRQTAYVWDLAREDAPLTFDQAILPSSGVGYSVGLSETKQWAYLAKGPYRIPRHHDFTGAFENLTLSLKLAGKGDVLLVGYQVRRTGPAGAVLYQGEFADSPAAELFEEGRDNPAGPLWGQIILSLEHGSFGDSPGDRGRVVWDNVRVRRYLSGEPPPPWRMLDDFSSGSLTNWFLVAFPEEKRSCRVEDGQLVLSCERLSRSQSPTGLIAYREPLEISRTHTLEIEIDLVSAQAPHRTVCLSVGRYEASPFAAPDRPFLAHGRWLATTWWDGPVRIWDLKQSPSRPTQENRSNPPLELGCQGLIGDLDFSPDTNWVAVADAANSLSIWDFRTGVEVTPATVKRAGVNGARFSLDNRFLAVSRADGLDLLRTADWQLAHRLGTEAIFRLPRFSPRGCRLAAVRNVREIVVWDLGDLPQPIATFPGQPDIKRMDFSPDGRYLATDSAKGWVQLWDVLRAAPFGPPLPGALARFSADGMQALLYGAEGGVWLWDLSRVADDTLLLPPLLGEQAFASSTQGTMTAAIEDQELVLKTPGSQYSLVNPVPLRRIGFSPDDQCLVAESADLRGWIWDIATRTLTGPPRPVRYDAALTSFSCPSLPLENRERQTLSDLAAVLGKQRPDGAGGLRPVNDAQRAQLFTDLKRAHPADFEADDTSRLCWHQEQARAAEAAMDWEAAVFHWEQALKGKPELRIRNDETSPNDEVGSLKSKIPNKSEIQEPKSEIPPALRLAYAREVAELVKRELIRGHSRWSVILPRPPWARPEMLDLGTFYTRALGEPVANEQGAALFRELLNGVQVLGGTGFDVRGFIRLSGTNPAAIPVGRPCRRLHFLHAATSSGGFGGGLGRGPVGTYKVTYSSGANAAVRLQTPEDVPPYLSHLFHEMSSRSRTNTSLELSSTRVWSGCAPRGRNEILFLTRTTWELPARQRGEVVASIELQAGSAESSPLIFAITIE